MCIMWQVRLWNFSQFNFNGTTLINGAFFFSFANPPETPEFVNLPNTFPKFNSMHTCALVFPVSETRFNFVRKTINQVVLKFASRRTADDGRRRCFNSSFKTQLHVLRSYSLKYANQYVRFRVEIFNRMKCFVIGHPNSSIPAIQSSARFCLCSIVEKPTRQGH